jgi:hypothetical protein
LCGTDLFDPEMLDEAMEEANVLIEALLAEDFLPLLIDNLGRLDEAVDEQAEAVHNVLGTVEHRTPHQHLFPCRSFAHATLTSVCAEQ